MMGMFEVLGKFGVSVLLGFVLGLLAIAWVGPVTTNGKVLLLLAVTALTIVCIELLRLLLRLIRSPPPKEDKPPE